MDYLTAVTKTIDAMLEVVNTPMSEQQQEGGKEYLCDLCETELTMTELGEHLRERHNLADIDDNYHHFEELEIGCDNCGRRAATHTVDDRDDSVGYYRTMELCSECDPDLTEAR